MQKYLRMVPFDFADINAIEQTNAYHTAQQPLGVAIAFSRCRAAYRGAARQCAAVAIAFEPVMLEAQGGIEPRAAAVLHKVAETVATIEPADAAKVNAQLLQRLAPVFRRQNASRMARRTFPTGKMPHMA